MTEFFDITHIAFDVHGYRVSYIELLGTLTGLVSVYYASRANILTWPTGSINAALLFILFYQVQLYADMFLQVYFFIITLYGWYFWNKKPDDKAITTMGPQKRLTTFIIVITGTLLAGYGFSHIHEYLPEYFTIPAAWPYADSFIMVASITATTLLAQKKIENWYLWLMVNIASIIVYYAKEVYFLSFEYVIFFGLASYGLFNWHKKMRNG
ncbi:nicotinamide riboside transporter PnuC [Flavobacterium sp.]|uniref:nicotinamide riboside transporter PnuC n=1 Tax=Flavobacterium sp. TaxID=239 RepID=UPI004033F0A7